MDSEIIFETIDLRREFGALVAVDDVSIKVRKNSSARHHRSKWGRKNTFFNLLSGNLEPTSGEVFFKGTQYHPPACS